MRQIPRIVWLKRRGRSIGAFYVDDRDQIDQLRVPRSTSSTVPSSRRSTENLSRLRATSPLASPSIRSSINAGRSSSAITAG